ncbi:MAG: hypothetical protein KAF91_16065 [Nostoc sp. TH1S01]|nr:hypothetical protein [Nostoc sp. TH1S01]
MNRGARGEYKKFQGFHLVEGKYQPITPTPEGKMWSQQLELYLGVYEGKLRYFTADHQLIPTPEEKAQQAEARAQQAETRAQQAQAEVNRLREILLAQGIDPDNI